MNIALKLFCYVFQSFDLLDPGNGQYSRVTEVHRSDQQTTVSLMINGNKYDIPV